MLEFAKYFVPAFYRAKELGMFYQTLAITNFDEEVRYYCQAHTPTPRLTPDGFVSCCDWASVAPAHLKPDALKELIYGYYDKEKKRIFYDEKQIEKIKSRNVDVLSQKACKDCEALHHCAGGCVGKISAVTNDFYEVTDSWCNAVRYLYKHLPTNIGDFPFMHP
jgi:radical SAM protein with 4Fe4S-binding SPASM domain